MSSLFVIRGNDQGSRFELEDNETVRLGRDATCPVRIHDTEVSRQHAELRCSGDTFVLSDLNSSNGTYVNGQRIQEHHLVTGDQVQVGRTLMLFTGPSGDSSEDLSQSIRIGGPGDAADQSQILRTASQDESEQLFVPSSSSDSDSNPWLARARSNLQVMYRTALAVSHTLDIDRLLNRIMELIFDWVETDRGCIMLVDAETGGLEPKVRRDRTKEGASKRTKPKKTKDSSGVSVLDEIPAEKSELEIDDHITISKTILDYVMEHNEGVLSSDARQDDRWSPGASILQAGVREAICVPMQGRYGVVGVIYIDTSTSAQEVIRTGGANKFTEDHLKLMVAIAHQAALAVEDTRYYSAMVQAERLAAIGQTVATLSHHIKNILQGIQGGGYLIEMGLGDDNGEVVRKGWGIVEKNQAKISKLVLDMLTFSKEREPERSPAKLNDVIGDVIELMQSRAEEYEVDLVWKPDESIGTFVFDPEGIHRASLNIVTNAIDAASENDEEKPTVLVKTELFNDGRSLAIVVKDNGRGIPTETMENLFDPFVSSKGSRGTGLGLPVSQKILKEHGGRIQVDSTPGRGAHFRLEFPAAEAEDVKSDSGTRLLDK
ncbi:MAG: ATP-binding protein [Planctomycetia bacterium]